MKDIRHKDGFTFTILIILLIDIIVLSNVPLLRQIFGFLFLTISPGLLIIQILQLNKIGLVEKFVLSIGLSISFLMGFGVLLNNILLEFNYETPLATTSLLISFNIAFIILTAIEYKVNKELFFSLPNLNLTTSEKAFLTVPILFPALSVFGVHVMNMTGNNIILIFLLFLIPAYTIFVCFFNQKFPKRLYPVVIVLTSISLLLLLSLRSNHITGIDTHIEYYFFQTTLNNLQWSMFGHNALDACLSISLLPTIYQSILNISPEFLFRILYSSICSILPLVIYDISKRYIKELYAFLASCFFMFQYGFLWTALYARTNTAILFFALAMMVFFSDRIEPLKKRILFITFMVSCIVSHYSTAYIFFIILLGSLIGAEIVSKKYIFRKNIDLIIIILFFTVMFFWYSQVTGTAFDAGVNFIGKTIGNLNRFFIEESRGGAMQYMHGGWLQKNIPYKIEFVFMWLTFMLIGIGITTMIRRHKEMLFLGLDFKRSDFLKAKFEVEYSIIALTCSGLLVVMFSLPYVSKGYGMDRLYAIAITILSVFFTIGGMIVAKHLKVRAYLIILLVLIPYFFSVTGITYNIFGVPRAITLNSNGDQYDIMYTHDQESCGAKWLKNHAQKNQQIYSADFFGGLRLTSQGLISLHAIDFLSFIKHKKVDGYLYLRCTNIVRGEMLGYYRKIYNIEEYSDTLIKKNEIYDSGCSKIYL